MARLRNLPALLVPVGLAVLAATAPHPAAAGEITLFWSRNQPNKLDTATTDATKNVAWRDGMGATLTLGLVKVAQVELEGARGMDAQGVLRMTYFTGGAALKLPFTKVTPFAGVGVGIYHQSVGDSWMINTHGVAFAGVKVRIADLLVLRGEYRRFQMRGLSTPFQALESRVTLGAGIAF